MQSLAGLGQGLLRQGGLVNSFGRLTLETKHELHPSILSTANLGPLKGTLPCSSSVRKSFSAAAPNLLSVFSNETAPKKPNTPWVQFVAEKMPLAKEHFPEIEPRLRMKMLSQKWKEVPLERKLEMEEEYREARAVWLLNKTEELTTLARQEKKLKKKLRQLGAANQELKHLLKKLEKPTQPPNSFIIYCSEQGWDGRRMFSGMASEWKQMEEREKGHYLERSLSLREEYELEMKDWKARMSREGWLKNVADLQQKIKQLKQEVKTQEDKVTKLKRDQTPGENS